MICFRKTIIILTMQNHDGTDQQGFTVRQFRPNDLPVVREIFTNAFKIYRDGQTSIVSPLFVANKLKSDMSDVNVNYLKLEGANFWVAETTKASNLPLQIIGMVGVIPYASEGHDVYELQRMSVVPEHHGKGVGKALLDQLEHFVFQERDGTKIILSTGADMKKAWRFYERNGFRKTDQVEEIPYKVEDGRDFIYFAQYFEKTRAMYKDQNKIKL